MFTILRKVCLFVLARELKCSNILQLFRNEFPASDAKSLGTYLNLPNTQIEVFRYDNMGAEGMLIDVLNSWLETDPEKSWSKLAEAVGGCGHETLAEKIRKMSSQ